MNLELNADDLKPLREKISTSIRDLIIEGTLKPGERLTEPEMSSSLGISRTPLREAFLQLESEGFVLVQPRRGAIVSGINLRDPRKLIPLNPPSRHLLLNSLALLSLMISSISSSA
jgi:DNA-binding GntR family transcriptional regulator